MKHRCPDWYEIAKEIMTFHFTVFFFIMNLIIIILAFVEQKTNDSENSNDMAHRRII